MRVLIDTTYARRAPFSGTGIYVRRLCAEVEAMRIGTPVLAARSPGITEVCADAVRYVDPCDPTAFATAMAELAVDPALRQDLRERGRRRAAGFSWTECARAHADAYSLAIVQ